MRFWLLAKLSAMLAFGIGTWLDFAYAGLSRPTGPLHVTSFSLDASELQLPVAQLPQPKGAGPAEKVNYTRAVRADFFCPVAEDGKGTPGSGALPVLVYFPGWPGTISDNVHMLADLASHGYVVVQVLTDHEDRRLAGAMDFSSEAKARETLWKAQTKVELQARDASTMLDALHRLVEAGTDRRLRRLDLDQVGILGFSFGGAIAAQAATVDRRFRAVLNMDGWLFGDGASLAFQQPYFLMSDDEADPTAAELDSPDTATRTSAQLTERDLQRLRKRLENPGALLMVIGGTGHESFSDTPVHFSLRGRGMPRPVQALRVSQIIRRYAQAFFAVQLKGARSPLLRSAASPYREVRLTLPP